MFWTVKFIEKANFWTVDIYLYYYVFCLLCTAYVSDSLVSSNGEQFNLVFIV